MKQLQRTLFYERHVAAGAKMVKFPVLPGNPYKIDVPATIQLIDEFRPELIIFGKSMVLHKEPVAEIHQFVDAPWD